jgi:hypothetical protein
MQAGDVLPCCYKLLAPPMYALAIMGRNDSNVGPFLEHTKCKLGCSSKGDWFPGTEDHIVVIQAFTDEFLAAGVQMVVQTMQEVPPQGQNGEYRLRIVLPQKAASSIGGQQQRADIKVEVDTKTWCGSGPEADQLLTVSGKLDGVQAIVSNTMEIMKQTRSSPWFPMWIGRRNADRIAETSMGGGMMPNNMGGMPMGTMGGMPMDGMGMGMGMGNMAMGNMGMMGGMGPGNAMGVGNGMRGTNGSLGETSFEILQSALRMIPQNVSEDPRGFSLRCAVPNRMVDGLLGKGGGVAMDVKDLTGARIDIPNNPNDPDNRAMSITGPLFSTVAAYIYMMKQYLEIEASGVRQEAGGGNAMNPGMGMGMGMGMNSMCMNMSPAEMKPLCAQALGQMEQQLTMQLAQVKQMKEQLAAIEMGGGQQM